MIKLRFGTGTSFDDFDLHYDTAWPTVPRTGEMLSFTVGTGQVVDWKVTDVCYVADGHEELIGALVLVEELARHNRVRHGT